MSELLDKLFGPDPAKTFCHCSHSKESHFQCAFSCYTPHCRCKAFNEWKKRGPS